MICSIDHLKTQTLYSQLAKMNLSLEGHNESGNKWSTVIFWMTLSLSTFSIRKTLLCSNKTRRNQFLILLVSSILLREETLNATH